MKITKDNIKINSYLVGLHSFRKDHNYGNYKANMINDIQTIFDSNFNTFKVGGIDILKFAPEESFEIRLTPSTIVYQDDRTYEDIISNAKQILDAWIAHSPKIKLSLIGLVINFEITGLEKPSDKNQLHIKNQFFKEIKLGNKLKAVDFNFNYTVNVKSYDYNVHLSLVERSETDYSISGSVDFNSTTDNRISGLSKENCDRIFSSAKEYFENDIIKIINMKG